MSEPVSSLLHAQLASTFGAHLGTLCERTARALQTSGFTSLLVHAGSLLEIFQDDRTYPFEAHAPFKVWVPLQDAPDSFVWFEPGTRPRLILHQPQDYWYQSAQTPQDYWVSHFDLRSAPDRVAGDSRPVDAAAHDEQVERLAVLSIHRLTYSAASDRLEPLMRFHLLGNARPGVTCCTGHIPPGRNVL